MKYLALKLPGGYDITPPGGIPSGGWIKMQTALQNSVVIVIGIAFIFVSIIVIWGGIMWITSQGDKQKLASARSRIIYGILGLILILLSFFIINVVGNLFQVKLL